MEFGSGTEVPPATDFEGGGGRRTGWLCGTPPTKDSRFEGGRLA